MKFDWAIDTSGLIYYFKSCVFLYFISTLSCQLATSWYSLHVIVLYFVLHYRPAVLHKSQVFSLHIGAADKQQKQIFKL